jgi:alcohol dehydrogenase (cytochrome c)
MRPLHRAILAATTVVMCAPLGAQDVDWPGYHLTLDGHRFSTLGQIDVDNVARLREHCRLPIEAGVPFQGGLVVVAGVLYATTTHATVAMNAADCSLLWRHDYVPSEEEVSPPNRGAAVDGGRVFRGTADGRLLALDAAKGTLLWKHAIGNPRLGEFVSSAPIAWQGMVYVGIAGGDRGIRGRIMAYDAMTGREIWRFNTIPMGNEAGAETWQNPDTARTGGGGTWSSYSLDVTTGELFVPVGNPGPDLLGSYRPGTNLFTNSLLVLDAASGALKWHYQLTPADTRDLDLASPPVLYRDTARRDLAAVAGKDGYLVTLDRNTRLPIFKVPVTTIRNEGLPVTPEGNTYCPGAGGGTQWNGPAFDRAGSALIVGAVDWCFEVRSGEATYSPGAIFYGGSMRPMGDAKGWITAVDAATGALRWRYASDAPIVAAITPTAGGLAFTGDMHGNFLALDSRTGAVRMKQATGGALAGGVVTYAVAGKQYVAVASGNVSRNTFGVLGTPTVIVYALPSETDGGVAGVGRGRDRYRSLCADCHGTDGALLSNANLQTVHQRRDAAGLRAYLKRPTPPMPKLYPEILDDAGVDDVARYLEQQLSRR